MEQKILLIFLLLISTVSFSQSKDDCGILDKKINNLKPLVIDILYQSNKVLRNNKTERHAISSIEELQQFMQTAKVPPSLEKKMIELDTKITSIKRNQKIMAIYHNCYTDKEWSEKMLIEFEKLWSEIQPNIDDDNEAIFKNILIDNPRYLFNIKYKN